MSGILGGGSLGDFGLGSGPDDDEPVGESAHDTLSVTDGASCKKPFRLICGDTISVSQGSVVQGPIAVSAGDYLQQTTISVDPITLALTEIVIGGLQDGASCQTNPTRLVGDTLSLGQGCTRVLIHATAIDCSASDTISLVDGSDATAPVEAFDTLEVTQGATCETSRPAGNDLNPTDGASVIIVRAVGSGNDVEISQGVTYALIRPCTDQKYNPFGGDLPATLPPAVASDGHLHLLWPATGVATEDVKLKNPNFGNSQRITTSRISRESRGGELIVYSDPIWPKFDSLVVSISFLTASQKTELLTFVKAHLGDEIKLIDWENRTWTGVLIPGDMITEDKHNSFTAAFEFEGERVLS